MRLSQLIKAVFVFALVSANLQAQTLIKNVALLSDSGDYPAVQDVLLRDGKIHAIGEALQESDSYTIIDGSGKRLSTGFFNANTDLGIREVGAVETSVDSSSANARITASLRVADAINPSSTLLPYNRSLGLTHALVTPSAKAGLFAGTAAVIRLSATGTVMKEAAAVVVELGSKGKLVAGGSRAAAFAQLREAFEDARDYRANKASYNSGNRRDYPLSRQDLQAIGSVISGQLPLLVFVDRAIDIERVLDFAKRQDIKLILAGVEEGWRVAKKIADAQVPVIVDPINNLPSSYDTLGSRLDNALLLHEAGVTLLFTGMSWHNTHNAYLVRQSAGNAVANGLPYEVAIAAMTTNPAKVFGLRDSLALKVGSKADLVLWGGDPLEPSTRVEAVWMAGEKQSLVTRSTRLRDRYLSIIKAAQ